MNPFWQNIFRHQKDKQTLHYFLSQVPMFAKLTTRELRFLEKLVHVRNFEAEEPVFSTGDIGSGMYIVRTGQVRIFVPRHEGTERELALLEPGDFFGEVALTASRPRSASARATTATVLVGLFRSDMVEAIRSHPAPMAKILLGLNRVLGDRLLQCSLQLDQFLDDAERSARDQGHD